MVLKELAGLFIKSLRIPKRVETSYCLLFDHDRDEVNAHIALYFNRHIFLNIAAMQNKTRSAHIYYGHIFTLVRDKFAAGLCSIWTLNSLCSSSDWQWGCLALHIDMLG